MYLGWLDLANNGKILSLIHNQLILRFSQLYQYLKKRFNLSFMYILKKLKLEKDKYYIII